MSEFEELEKRLKEVDLNKNGVADRTEIKNFFVGLYTWVKTHKVNLILGAIIVLLIVGYTKKEPLLMNTPVVGKAAPSEVSHKQSLDTNVFKMDLSKAEVTKVLLKDIQDLKENKEGEKFVVWYRMKLDNGNTYWLTVKELNINGTSNLNYNKVKYDEYVQKLTLEAEKLSK